jgi:hypothetical protein
VYDLCETVIVSYGQKNDRKSALSTVIGFVLFLARLLNLLRRSTICRILEIQNVLDILRHLIKHHHLLKDNLCCILFYAVVPQPHSTLVGQG